MCIMRMKGRRHHSPKTHTATKSSKSGPNRYKSTGNRQYNKQKVQQHEINQHKRHKARVPDIRHKTKVTFIREPERNAEKVKTFFQTHDVKKWQISENTMIIEYIEIQSEYGQARTKSKREQTAPMRKRTIAEIIYEKLKNTKKTGKSKEPFAVGLAKAIYSVGRDMAKLNAELSTRMSKGPEPKMFCSDGRRSGGPKLFCSEERKSRSSRPKMFCSETGSSRSSGMPKMFCSETGSRPKLF